MPLLASTENRQSAPTDVRLDAMINSVEQPSAHAGRRDELIQLFNLLPHPEGGFYRETYRANGRVQRSNGVASAHEAAGNMHVAANEAHNAHIAEQPGEGTHAASTAIYYLLCDRAFSAWHRIRSDEIWHFYAGDPVDIHVLRADGSTLSHRLGNPLQTPNAVFQVVVEAGDWFAAGRVSSEDECGFTLSGCTVAPGFEFAEFEIATLDVLLASHPQHQMLIKQYCSVLSSGDSADGMKA